MSGASFFLAPSRLSIPLFSPGASCTASHRKVARSVEPERSLVTGHSPHQTVRNVGILPTSLRYQSPGFSDGLGPGGGTSRLDIQVSDVRRGTSP